MKRFGTSYNKGFTLYLVVVLITVMGTLISISLSYRYSSLRQIIYHSNASKATSLAYSGLERAEYFLNGGDNHSMNWETELFKESFPTGKTTGEIKLTCSRFALLSRIESVGTVLQKSDTISALFGRSVPQEFFRAITLTGHIGGMILHKGTTIDGIVKIHHGSIKRGKNRIPIAGAEKWTENGESPTYPFSIDPIRHYFEQCEEVLTKEHTDYLGTVYINDNRDTLLLRDTLWINGSLTLDNLTIEDKVFIVQDGVSITKGSSLREVVIIAKKEIKLLGSSHNSQFYSDSSVIIAEGSHQSQFLSPDVIEVSKKATFPTFSFWINRRKVVGDTTLTGKIIFEPQGVYRGHTVSFTDSIEDKSKLHYETSIALGKYCTYEGTLMSDGDLSLIYTTIKGSLWCRSIVSYDEGTSYKNWILGCTISSSVDNIPYLMIGKEPATIREIP